MSIGLTHTEEKKSDSTAKHANNERGHSMPGRIAGRSSKLSALFAGLDARKQSAQLAAATRNATRHGMASFIVRMLRGGVTFFLFRVRQSDTHPNVWTSRAPWRTSAAACRTVRSPSLRAAPGSQPPDVVPQQDYFQPAAAPALRANTSP